MKLLRVAFYLAIWLGAAFDLAAVAQNQAPAEGASLPAITLPAPKDADHGTYLGVTGKKDFTVADIAAEVVIIEIFNMYWPFCQKEAPSINEVYQKIEADPTLKGKVKMIGIGVGNSAFEVDYFKKTYTVLFPLFPDPEFKIHKLVGEVRTPYFIGVKNQKDAAPKVYYSKLGGAKDAEELLKKLLANSGLQ